MKIVVVGPAYQNQPQSVVDALNELGHNAVLYSMTEFYNSCTYWQRKQYKWGNKRIEEEYNRQQAEQFQKFCRDESPDLLFVLNGLMIDPMVLDYVKEYPKVLWLWDSVRRSSRLERLLSYFKEIYVFEYTDMEYLKEKYQIDVQYLPLGYDQSIYYPIEREKDIDISFIGIPTAERLTVLDKVAKFAAEKNLNMKIGGPWYSKSHFWKKWQFAWKHPTLIKYIENRQITPQEAADIYRRSKVCLNISVKEHKSINPRTVEILATKSFQIMNRGQDAYGLFDMNNSVVFFEDHEELIEKIREYISAKDKREAIAEKGYLEVKDSLSIKSLLEKYYCLED